MTLRTAAFLFALPAALLGLQSASQAELMYGLNGAGNNLFTFDSTKPSQILSGSFISGLASNEEILAIDVRPATGAVYGVGSFNHLYTINPNTGAASLVGSITGATVNGTNFDVDFNPVTDSLRLGSDTTQNLRISPTTAVATVDGNFSYGNSIAPNIVGLAYTNNVPGAVSTTLYGLDSGTNSLVIVNPANSGTLSVVGSTGIDFTDLAGFDISLVGNTAYAALQTTSSPVSHLYHVDLSTGLVSDLGQIGGGLPVRDITLVGGGGQGVPEPATLSLLALAIPALLTRRSKK